MNATQRLAASARPVRFRKPPRIRKPLRKDEHNLPRPPVKLSARETHACRLGDHYYTTLRDDLMYLTYVHEREPRRVREVPPKYDPADPYTLHRHNPLRGGSRDTRKPPPPSKPENVVKLEKVCIHMFHKKAIASRSQLLGPIAAFRALTGETEGGGGRRSSEGVQIVRGKKNVGQWIRQGQPCGVRVTLKGDKMYDFLGTLVEFVLPRLREFSGVVMPAGSATLNAAGAVSGVVSFGLPPVAMSLFPQIEVNMTAFPNMYGMHIHLVTNARGIGAQNRARTLASGLQIPFIRK